MKFLIFMTLEPIEVADAPLMPDGRDDREKNLAGYNEPANAGAEAGGIFCFPWTTRALVWNGELADDARRMRPGWDLAVVGQPTDGPLIF